MKHWILTLAGVVALALVADLVVAQQRGRGGRGQQSQQRERFGGPSAQAPGGGQYRPGGGQFGPGGGPQFRHPLMVILDTDEDGEISTSEIKNAAKELLKLDKNEDDKLTLDELRPESAPGRGGGFGPGQGGPGRGFGGPGQGGPGQGGAGGPGRGGFGAGGFAERLMQMDANDDGKITADEVPERMQMMLKRVDTNDDGAIDEEEAKAFAAQFQQGPGRGPGPAGGQRPQRGQRPQSDW